MPAEKWLLSAAGKWECSGRESFTNRDSLVYGNYRPSELNTGVLNLATLDTHTGDFVTTYHGQLVENIDITGRIKIRHDGVVFRNCRAQGGLPNGSASFGTAEAFQMRLSPTKFYDCTFIANPATNPAISDPRYRNNANSIQGRDYELYRCDLSGSIDGLGAQYSNVAVKGSRIHGLAWYPDSHTSGGESHSDGGQVHGGTGFTFVGNAIEVGYRGNAGIQVTQDVGATSGLIIHRNWFISTHPVRADACTVGLNVSQGSGAAMADVTITENRFSALDSWRVNHAGLIDAPTFDTATISGNVYDETNLPAKITRVNV